MASSIAAGTTAGTALAISGDTSGALQLQTNGTTTAVTIDTSQNVGIGTTSPSYKLDVTGVARLGNGVTAIAPSATDIPSTAHTILSTTGGNGLFFGQYPSATNYAQWIQSSYTNPTTATYSLLLQPLGGNVGIGTSSADALLHVSNGAAKIRIGATTSSAYLDISRDGTTGYSIYNAAQADPYRGHIWQLGGTEAMRIDTAGLLKFNSGYGSVATAYGCRAWVNFNGTGTVAIRASGNVSSITDNGVGDYTVNFTTAMVDANYSAVGMAGSTSGVESGSMICISTAKNTSQATGNVRVQTRYVDSTLTDVSNIGVAIFR